MSEDFSQELAVAKDAARRAGKLLRDNLNRQIEISKKGQINLVTEMDLQSEHLIVEAIRGRFPDHQILAEEQGLQEAGSIFKWVIDPLDGTTNYAHGYRFFCVSIALEADSEIVLGVVYDPVTDELFSAAKGEGAWLNGKPARVSTETSLGESMICTGFSYHEAAVRENLRLFNEMILAARAVRRDGAAALDLCYVACGRFDGFWELKLSPWDVAAGKIIVEEAGGLVSLFNGSPCSIYDQEILATNGRIHRQMYDRLA